VGDPVPVAFRAGGDAAVELDDVKFTGVAAAAIGKLAAALVAPKAAKANRRLRMMLWRSGLAHGS
jgi:hypothetical protein